MKKTILAGICSITMMGSQASAHRVHCLIDAWDLLKTETKLLPGCRLDVPLTLVQIEENYPKMTENPWPVRIWQGRYVRQIEVDQTIQHTLYDKCQGVVVSRNEESTSKLEDLDFDVENPNLSPDIATTYELAPMTDTEAQAALKKAEASCLQSLTP